MDLATSKTPKLNLFQLGSQRLAAGSIEMQFITSDTVMMTNDHHIDFCALVECPERGYALQKVLCLQLPELAPSVSLSTTSALLLDDSGRTGTVAHPSDTVPLFSTSMSTSVCAVSINVTREDADGFRFRSFVLVMRCASLLNLVDGVLPEERITWLQPSRGLYMDGELAEPTGTLSQPTGTTGCSPRTMDVASWSKEGVLWLDCGEEDETRGIYVWSVVGSHLLGFADDLEDSIPGLPLRIFHFNKYDIDRSHALAEARAKSTGQEEELGLEFDHLPFDSSLGPWFELPNGKKMTIVEQPFSVPAGDWWTRDLVSTLPFSVTQTKRAERWPFLTVHGNLVLRKQQTQPTVSYRRAT